MVDVWRTRIAAIAAGWWRDLRIAAGFLTILPLAAEGLADAGQRGFLASATVTFPLIGAAIGAAAALVLLMADAIDMPPLAAALLAVATLALVTGALHEDGLGDVADGFGGGRTREDKLRIMRDSRVGTYGVVSVVFSVALRAAALAALPVAAAAAALVTAAALSRAGLPAVMHWLPPARGSGLGAAAGTPSVTRATAAAAIAVVIALATLGPAIGSVTAAAAAAGTALVALLARQHIGGHTGDVCGAAQQVSEIAALLAIAASR